MSDYKLPENFLWGAAIAANQADNSGERLPKFMQKEQCPPG